MYFPDDSFFFFVCLWICFRPICIYSSLSFLVFLSSSPFTLKKFSEAALQLGCNVCGGGGAMLNYALNIVDENSLYAIALQTQLHPSSATSARSQIYGARFSRNIVLASNLTSSFNIRVGGSGLFSLALDARNASSSLVASVFLFFSRLFKLFSFFSIPM